WAFEAGRYEDTEKFMILYRGSNTTGGFLALQGFITPSLTLLQRSIESAQKRGDKEAESNWLGNLATAYFLLAEYRLAAEWYEKALYIGRQIGDKGLESNWLSGLSNTYFRFGDYPKAIEFSEQALILARQIGDQRIESTLLGNLGSAYDSLGDYPK